MKIYVYCNLLKRKIKNIVPLHEGKIMYLIIQERKIRALQSLWHISNYFFKLAAGVTVKCESTVFKVPLDNFFPCHLNVLMGVWFSLSLQCFDMALNTLFFYTLAEQLDPKPVLALETHFRSVYPQLNNKFPEMNSEISLNLSQFPEIK